MSRLRDSWRRARQRVEHLIATRPRLVAGVASGVGLVLVVLAIVFLSWLPSIVRAKATSAIERKLGLRATIGEVSVGLANVSLEDVVLVPRRGRGLRIGIGELDLDAGPIGLAFGGSSAIEDVEIEHLDVAVDLRERGIEQTLSRVRDAIRSKSDSEREGGHGARAHIARTDRDEETEPRGIRIEEMRVRVRDEQGALVAGEHGTVEGTTERARLGFGRLDVGGSPGDQGSLRGLSVVVSRREGTALIEQARVRSADFVWGRRDEAADAPNAPLSTRERLRKLARAITGADADEEEEPERGRVGRWLNKLSPNVLLRVDALSIRARTAQGERGVVRKLEGQIAGRGHGRFDASGRGEASTGGTVQWDLRVWPSLARGEGSVRFENLPLAVIVPFLPDAVPWYEPERGRLGGELVLRAQGRERLVWRGSVHVTNAALSSQRIAPQPVRGIDVMLAGEGTWLPPSRRLELRRGAVTMGGATVNMSGVVEWAPDHYLFDISANLPPTDCNAAVGAIPRDLLAELGGFSWTGTLGGTLRAVIDSRKLDDTVLDLDVADACEFETVPAVADLRRFEGPFVHRVVEPNGQFFEMQTGPGTAGWSGFGGISPYLVHAVLAHEDGGFFAHHGFLLQGIRTALVRNLKEGRYRQGASTITMQLVKNVFLRREKTLARKVQEVLLTWWIERVWPKMKILELYLNVIEYGPAVYGIRHAAQYYFSRTPDDLSPAESVFLATVLPNPKAYHANFSRGSISPELAEALRRQLNRLATRGQIDAQALAYGLAEVDHFQFHGTGSPPPERRLVPGAAAPVGGSHGEQTWPDEGGPQTWDEGGEGAGGGDDGTNWAD